MAAPNVLWRLTLQLSHLPQKQDQALCRADHEPSRDQACKTQEDIRQHAKENGRMQ
jgi:hypothetical protein